MKSSICKYCGEEFIQNKRGKKKNYCYKKECIKKAKADANHKWYSNKIKVLAGTKMRIKEGKTIVFSTVDKNNSNEDFIDIIEYSRRLASIRYEAVEKIKQLYSKQSQIDTDKEVLVHDIEHLASKDEVTNEEIVDTVKKHMNKILDRRKIKDKEEMYQRLISGMIKNPTEYVTDFIKKRDKRTYNPNKNGGNDKGIGEKVQNLQMNTK